MAKRLAGVDAFLNARCAWSLSSDHGFSGEDAYFDWLERFGFYEYENWAGPVRRILWQSPGQALRCDGAPEAGDVLLIGSDGDVGVIGVVLSMRRNAKGVSRLEISVNRDWLTVLNEVDCDSVRFSSEGVPVLRRLPEEDWLAVRDSLRDELEEYMGEELELPPTVPKRPSPGRPLARRTRLRSQLATLLEYFRSVRARDVSEEQYEELESLLDQVAADEPQAAEEVEQEVFRDYKADLLRIEANARRIIQALGLRDATKLAGLETHLWRDVNHWILEVRGNGVAPVSFILDPFNDYILPWSRYSEVTIDDFRRDYERRQRMAEIKRCEADVRSWLDEKLSAEWQRLRGGTQDRAQFWAVRNEIRRRSGQAPLYPSQE